MSDRKNTSVVFSQPVWPVGPCSAHAEIAEASRQDYSKVSKSTGKIRNWVYFKNRINWFAINVFAENSLSPIRFQTQKDVRDVV